MVLISLRTLVNYILISIIWSSSDSFNVDINYPILLEPKSVNSENIDFGASVAIHHNKYSRFLIGAPKAYSVKYPTIRTGAVFSCSINTTSQCAQIQEFAKENVNNTIDMLLGFSVSSKSKSSTSIACSHLRINEAISYSNYPNGACNLVKLNGSTKYDKILEPFKLKDSQIVRDVYYYSHALFGFSSLFIKDIDLLVVGAPGFYSWTGAIVLYTASSNYINPLIRYISPSKSSYFGYSIASGRLFQNKYLYIATGAPKYGEDGAVYYFPVNNLLSSNNQIASIYGHNILRGQEMSEYFGYSILIVDINDDLMDDLIVGAPLFSSDTSRRGDIGRVYIFQSNDAGFSNPYFIYGNRKPESRFGSTLAELGDINADGYKDIIIGAPYENGCGAIYIYHGSKFGLSEPYSQHISGCTHFPSYNLKGFGFSISSGIDIDGNKYPDILIGAPLSDNGIILKSQPVGSLKVGLQFNVFSIDAKKSCKDQQNNVVPCFNVTYCLNLTGKYLTGNHTIEVKINIDTLLGSDGVMSRGYFVDVQGNKWSKSKSIIRQTSIQAFKEFCERPIQVMINREIRDKLTPLELTLKYRLATKSTGFCSNCPYLIGPSAIYEQIFFETGCGSDRICLSDVTMSLSLASETGPLTSIIEGDHESINLIISLINYGENAHSAKITLYVQPPLKTSFISSEMNETMSIIKMDVGNPLEQGSKDFPITFDLRSPSIDSSKINFSCIFTTRSNLVSDTPIRTALSVKVERFASIDMIGYESDPIFVDHSENRENDNEKLILLFTIVKSNSSSIRSPVVVINLPVSLPNNENFIYKPRIESLDSTAMTCELNKLELEQIPIDEDVSDKVAISEALKYNSKTLISRERRAIAENSNSSTEPPFGLNCLTTVCKKIECRIGSFGPGQKAVNFRLVVVAKLNKLEKSFGSDVRVFLYSAEAKATFLDSMVSGNKKWSKTAISEIELKQLPHKEAASFWVIAGCSFAGLVLFLLIIIALIKVGFFKRKTRQQTEVLKQRYSMAITPNMLKELQINLNEDDSDDDEYVNHSEHSHGT